MIAKKASKKPKNYLSNKNLKAGGVSIEFTEEQVKEYIKCAKDPCYFVNNYMHIINLDGGKQLFKLYDYQEDLLKSLLDNRFVIAKLPRQVGKALCIQTPILTPDGFKKMEDIEAGDYVYGRDGLPTKVTYKSPTFNKKTYKITFDTGDTVTCCHEHLWSVHTANWRPGEKTLNTDELYEYITTHKSVRDAPIYIQATKPIEFSKKELPLDPYMLGVWLGDGTSSIGRITMGKQDCKELRQILESRDNIFEYDYINHKAKHPVHTIKYTNLHQQIKKLGVINNKHIPQDYLYSTIEDRLDLLRGLMDTDGSAAKNGRCEFYQKSKKFILQVKFLLSSLGIKSRLSAKIIKGQTYHTLRFCTAHRVFNLKRKADRQSKFYHPKNTRHYIAKIEVIENAPTQCISVANEDRIYLAGEALIPTHNTSVSVAFFLWTILFQNEQRIAILSNKASNAKDALGKIKLAYEMIPQWMQQGVVEWNKFSIKLENGSEIIASATTGSAGRSGSFNCITGDSLVTVKNKQTGLIESISINELKQRLLNG